MGVSADFKRRLTLKVATQSSGPRDDGPNLATLRKLLTSATLAGRYIDYKHARAYAARLEEIVGTLERLLEENADSEPRHARALFELAEYGIERLIAAMNQIDDSSGRVSGLLVRLIELHQRAATIDPPDPKALAAYLFEHILHSSTDMFSDALSGYADALGREGLQEYDRLVEAEWAKVPERGPEVVERPRRSFGQDYASRPNYYRITSMMERRARAAGDIDALVAVKSRDLSSSYHFVEIAETLRRAERYDEALAWAERGDRAFAHDPDTRLKAILIEEYARRGRHEDTLRLLRAEFERRPNLETYRALIEYLRSHGTADRAEAERQKALARLKQDSAQPYHWDILRVYLYEDDLDAAWAEASTGRYPPHLLMALAEKLAPTRPEDALTLYRRLVPSFIEGGSSDYAEGADLLLKIRHLFLLLDRDAEWVTYIATIRETYRRKRNLLKTMQERGI
jgi:hypothetical protein